MLAGVAHGTELNFGRTRRHTHYHTELWSEEVTAAECHLYHAANHLLCGVEVGNHTIAKWTDGTYVGWSLTLHLLCLVTYGNHFLTLKGDD